MFTTASVIPEIQRRDCHVKKPAAFYLAGDSTTAAQSAGGGGWGIGFLKTLVNGAIGTDFGHNGATTVSFVAGADWPSVLDAVSRSKADFVPYVTIQFGHNDQKAAANISIDQFTTNLKTMASQVIAAGGTPILVTSLSRRNYNSSGLVTEDLAPQRAATIAAATSMNISYIDLNAASIKYLNSIGSAKADTYNLVPTDRTHLNAAGSVVFGAMVSWLLETTIKEGRDIADYTKANRTVLDAVKAGTYILPTV
ncbi:carbohydrate esterase family 12 protein [Halenospora varia]|nr:carbohydrate esterase family 12 protein [Halenospora varia]